MRLFAFGVLLLALPAALSSKSSAQIGIGVGISVRIGPPALPVYEQPACPGPGNLWTPGYWAWSDDVGYYWVPGTWVVAPVGLLWTPGYWGWNDGVFAWNEGYWGPQIGFYGGINYGFGYGGVGFFGGEWRGGAFFYNSAVMNVNTTEITNVYVNREVIVNNESHVAFNGGEGGVTARPTPQQEAYAREKHTPPLSSQVQHAREASRNPELAASRNHGAPAVAATAKPGEFSGRGVVAAKAPGAPYHAPALSPKEARASAPAGNRSAARGANEPKAKAPARGGNAHTASEARAKAPAHAEKARPTSEARTKAPAKTPAREEKARAASEPKAKTPAREEKARPTSEARTKAPAKAPARRGESACGKRTEGQDSGA